MCPGTHGRRPEGGARVYRGRPATPPEVLPVSPGPRSRGKPNPLCCVVPLVRTRARLWFKGAKVRKHGVAVFGQARVAARHVPRNTRVAGISHPYPLMTTKQCPIHQRTPHNTRAHVNHSYTYTLTPTWTPPAACTKLQITFSIGLAPQKRWFQKRPKCAETRGRRVWTSLCSDKRGVPAPSSGTTCDEHHQCAEQPPRGTVRTLKSRRPRGNHADHHPGFVTRVVPLQTKHM